MKWVPGNVTHTAYVEMTRAFFFSGVKCLSLSGFKNGHTLESGIYLRKIIMDVHIDLPVRMFVTVF